MFAPCVPSINPQCTAMVTLTTVLLHFFSHLFPLVAIHVLTFPLCWRPLLCTPSSYLAQRAPALLLTFPFVDPPACFPMFPRSFRLVKTLGSLPYVLPRFLILKTTASSIGVFVFPFHICSFSFYFGCPSCQFVLHCFSSSTVVRTNLRIPNAPQHVPATFRRALDRGSSTHLLHSPSEVFIFHVLILLFIFSESFNHFDH